MVREEKAMSRGRRGTETAFKLMREKRGYSQEGLAEKTGLNLRTIQYLEQGHADSAKAATLLLCAKAMRCLIEDLMDIDNAGNLKDVIDDDSPE